MMKVLAISASPRKGGNSDVLCDQFLKGAADAGHKIEKIRLAEKKIAPCMACYGCTESHRCVIGDDMDQMMQKMIDADVIVLATPVYFYCMAAQMKIMIDRCLARYREMTDKQVYLIATAADPQHDALDETLAGMRGFIRCLPGGRECGVIYGTGTWDKGDVYKHPALEQAYDMGKEV
ncbi:MAG: flavodoxin family protein [Catenibacillus sp.]